MIRIPLPWHDAALLLTPRWDDLGPAAQAGLLALLLLAPLGLALGLYRRELRLVSRRTAAVLLSLRLLLLFLLWAVAGWQPVLVHDSAEELAGRVIVAVDCSRSMDVPDPQRSVVEQLRLARALKLTAGVSERLLDTWIEHFEQHREGTPADARDLDHVLREMDGLTRRETARRILTPEGGDLLRRLAERHQVELMGFDDRAWSADPSRPHELFARSAGTTGANGTDLRQPLLKALQKSGTEDGPLLGVVLLSDGGHNRGPSPLVAAAELGGRKIPIYPIAVGARQAPPDVAVLEVSAPHDVLKEVEFPVQARVRVSALPAQDIRVEMHQVGKPLDPSNVRMLRHDGKDRIHELLFETTLAEAGVHRLEIKAAPADPQTREVTQENNVRGITVRVSDDRMRVLLVDGEARWEYQYLANLLARDKTLELDRVVFSQPRLGQIAEEKLEKLGHPRLRLPEPKDGDDPLAKYHCIVLGDVLPEHLSLAERRRLEKYVGERGGALIVVAGKRAMPLAFSDPSDPLVKLLPIADPRVWKPEPALAEAGFAVKLTPEGSRTPFLRLAATPELNVEQWAELPKHFWGIVGRAKPGAAGLAFVAEEKSPPAPGVEKIPVERRQGLLVQQQYGFGRVLFVGLDSTWRWRYRVGDTHHHRFWTQVVRWAASDQLLPAGSRHVRYGSLKPVYRQGDEIEIAVRLGDDVPLLKAGAAARARLIADAGGEPPTVVPLQAAESQPRLLEGKAGGLSPGAYRIELDVPGLGDHLKPGAKDQQEPRTDVVTVLPPEDLEMLDLATDWSLLENLASHSQGELFTPESVEGLLDRLGRQAGQRQRHAPARLWLDPPWVGWLLATFLSLLAAEWLVRKWAGLA